MKVNEAILSKRAIRDFSDRPILLAEAETILNAGRRSQSSKNTQSWKFLAIFDREKQARLAACGQWAGHIASAQMAVALLTPDPTEKFQTMFDCGQAAAYMQLAAWELGIGSCPASIYEPEQARQILSFGPEWHLRIVLSFGYPARAEALISPNKQGGRKSLEEVVEFIGMPNQIATS
jgi:nitroreductase